MSHPLFWLSKTFFYPIGNTAPICLTQDLSPEQSADILLLGCGDPRNILFTLYADVVATPSPRSMDITCCDIEPAILARNILLFSLLEEGEHVDRIWDIFFHFKFDDRAQKILTQQSHRLFECAKTIESWRESPCGSFLKLVDTRTLAEVRRCWKSYADFSQLPAKRLERLQKEQTALSKSMNDKYGIVFSASRSAGMLWPQAMGPVNTLFRRYWETGTTFTLESDVKKAKNLNPTFVYSMAGEMFDPHYGTFPQGFHLTPAFSPIASDPAGLVPSTGSCAINTSKQQFKAWCGAFRKSRAAGAIKIRFFAGDALAFCRAMRSFSTTGRAETDIFVSAWRAPHIKLDELSASVPSAPTSYDIIDTSNLTDHLGLLNLLLATQPLLKSSPVSQSVLYTENLLASGDDATRSYLKRICTNVPTISLLLGLAPRPYISNFTTHSNVHELVSNDHVAQFHERVPWVDPASGDRYANQGLVLATFDTTDLAYMLFGVYEEMFSQENLMANILSKPSLTGLHSMSKVSYHRETVAVLFQAIKSRVFVSGGSWDDVADKFLELVEADMTRPIGMNCYQDLCLQFHLLGIYTPVTLQPGWRARFGMKPASQIFEGWPEVPPVLCVTLSVPRKSLEAFLKDRDTIGSPTLQCGLTAQGTHSNIFSAIHAVWGKLVTRSSSEDLVVEEDPRGMNGTSDLVVSFWAPSRILEIQDTSVALAIKSTPAATIFFMGKLGMQLHVFEAKLADKRYVRLLHERPVLASDARPTLQAASSVTPANAHRAYTITPIRSQNYITSLSAHLKIQSALEQESLLKGEAVSAAQISPCSMKISIGRYQHVITFPYPIHGTQNKLRIARKSHYVEVVVPASKPLDSSGYFLQSFPILRQTAYSPWNVHCINLERMPMLDLQYPKKLDWLNSHSALQLSDRERAMHDSDSKSKAAPENVFLNIKESIHALVMHCSGVQGDKTRALGLCEPSNGGIYAILLVGALRLDLASLTVLLDTDIIPLSQNRMSIMALSIQKLQNDTPVMQIKTVGHEAVAWKKLLPAYVERCRTWRHKPNCEYKSHDAVPLSVELDQTPICTCGEGLGFSSSEWNVRSWKGLLRFATRAAISPLFSVSYIETVAGAVKSLPVKTPSEACWSCGGPGKPTLSACSKCKKARYCSTECQHRDWKTHKASCKAL
ncbi:hypothetical protein BDV93DRAFT_569974 [Ceratobasidium sp. AG-I]|nr:hypothetical protein BDV93DRAFT_569974 [Ceratobasidium sp. AG-I]